MAAEPPVQRRLVSWASLCQWLGSTPRRLQLDGIDLELRVHTFVRAHSRTPIPVLKLSAPGDRGPANVLFHYNTDRVAFVATTYDIEPGGQEREAVGEALYGPAHAARDGVDTNDKLLIALLSLVRPETVQRLIRHLGTPVV